jgi:hypothetical protein
VVGSPLAEEERYQGKENLRKENNIIQFNFLFYFILCAASTAKGPITDTAQI